MADEEEKTVQCLTTKEIKALAKPEFAANPEKFYPTKVLEGFGFSRHQCPKCQNNYWRHSEKADTCGDSQCVGKYTFIGNGVGKGKTMTFAEAWQGFEKSFTTTKVPNKSIDRYPVVARWRNDVDYVAAGIFCFQPYCTSGEIEPPANPLIQPQFCVRFNDLDNIGVTGRHYSGFIMMGNQVFNFPNDYKYFKDEAIEYNYRWLTETLEIDPDEITFVEDVWAGGGNLGPSIEYFVRGLEVGNMVFMQYKTFHDGTREELDIKIIDTGIGLERIAWLYNGTATSYMDTFANAMEYLQSMINLPINNHIWEKFGPYSCVLNIDEVDNVDDSWKKVADLMGEDVQIVKDSIQDVRDLYIILDHTRSILLTISDGSLPSNVGGGGNVRNILRRCFAIMHKNDWWNKVGIDNFLQIFEHHKKDLFGIYGEFPEYKSFGDIIRVEFERWQTTDEAQAKQLEGLLKKKKNKLTIDDWIVCIQSYGIGPDKVAEISKQPIPGNLYYEISIRQERVAKAAETILYNTAHLPETDNLYYKDHSIMEFDAKVVDVFANVLQKNKKNILIMDRSAIYPTSGGQIHDTGSVKIEGIEEEFEIIDAVRVGKVVLHTLDREIEQDKAELKDKKIYVKINDERRRQLMAHHTGTHIVFAACRKVLGPHVWQNGAKKTTEQAHLDITHFKSLSKEEEKAIESQANRTINGCFEIKKSFMDKAEAERQYGFRLYQGGIVPGNELRVVDIAGIDTEACCGTHCDSTAEVGWIKIIKSARISDGVVRLYYVAYERAIEELNRERDILNNLCDTWGINQTQIMPTAVRFFNDYKKLSTQTKKQDQQILSLQVKYLLKDNENKIQYVKSEQPNPTLYFSFLPKYAKEFKEGEKGLIFIGSSFVLGLVGNPESIDVAKIEAVCKETSSKPVKAVKKADVKFDEKIKGQKPIVTKGILLFSITGQDFNMDKIQAVLDEAKLIEME